jgi:CheY-like chemotaxis protein
VTVVAVVEDHPANRMLISAILGSRYELHEYADGGEALEAFKTSPPQVVLLDISLPGMDGLAVLARIRADEQLRAIPVVALTAHATQGDRERFIASGIDEYVPKPIVDFESLVAKVDRFAEHGRADAL